MKVKVYFDNAEERYKIYNGDTVINATTVTINEIAIDEQLSDTSANAVENRTVKKALDDNKSYSQEIVGSLNEKVDANKSDSDNKVSTLRTDTELGLNALNSRIDEVIGQGMRLIKGTDISWTWGPPNYGISSGFQLPANTVIFVAIPKNCYARVKLNDPQSSEIYNFGNLEATDTQVGIFVTGENITDDDTFYIGIDVASDVTTEVIPLVEANTTLLIADSPQELKDIRVDYYGTIHDTAGDSVRSVTSDLIKKAGNVKQEYIELDITDFTSGRVKDNVSVGAELQTESSTTWEYTTVNVGNNKDFKIIFTSRASSYSHYIVGVDENNIITEIHGEATPDASTTQTVEFTCLSNTVALYISNFSLSTDSTLSVNEKILISLQDQINSLINEDLDLQEKIDTLQDLNLEKDLEIIQLNKKAGNVKQEYIELDITDFTSGRVKNNVSVGAELQTESSTTWEYTTVNVGDYKDYKIIFRSPASSYSHYIIGVDENNKITEIHGEATPDENTTQTVEFTCLSNTVALYISNFHLSTDTYFSVNEKRYISLQDQINVIAEDIENLKNTVTYSMSVANFNSANFDNMNDTRSIILYL